MRSTVDLQDILDKKLRKAAQEHGLTFKAALNSVVAAGLHIFQSSPTSKKRKYRVKAKACGLQPGIDYEHLNRIFDESEDDSAKEKLTRDSSRS